MTAGLGLSNRAIFKDAENNQAIVNGLNLDLNPLGFIIFCFMIMIETLQLKSRCF